jgi:hypothetical protein
MIDRSWGVTFLSRPRSGTLISGAFFETKFESLPPGALRSGGSCVSQGTWGWRAGGCLPKSAGGAGRVERTPPRPRLRPLTPLTWK